MRKVYAGLVHFPVRDRAGATITTAVTNLDVHDIARSARTYDLAGYFVVTPIEVQRQLVERILEHWRDGAGARRVPERSRALAICSAIASIEEAVAAVTEREGQAPFVLATGARPMEGTELLGYAAASERMVDRPALILFGTGHGLAHAVIEAADGVLPPIRPAGGYNHLSVRAAAAITFDRLFGDGGC